MNEKPELRYAVLHHTHVAHPHYDLLLETAPDAPLATWRCEKWPPESEMTVVRLPDHRRVYLDYEGPISGGRGEVSRVAHGSLRLLEKSDTHFRIRLGGAPTLTLSLLNEDRWLLQSKR